jgi:hypothetical protein
MMKPAVVRWLAGEVNVRIAEALAIPKALSLEPPPPPKAEGQLPES